MRYTEIVNLYKSELKNGILKGWDHLLFMLTVIKNKTADEEHKIKLENYIKIQKQEQLNYITHS